MHFHYTFIQKTTVACSQICVLEVNVVQTARTLTPAQKTKNHHQKDDHFVDVDRAMGVKQLVVMEELVLNLRSEELLEFIGMNIAMGLL